MSINLRKANHFLPHILLIGAGIGTANYFMNGDLDWLQWVIQSLITSLLIGYSLVTVAANKAEIKAYFKFPWQCYLCLVATFFLVGVLASEVEYFIRSTVFSRTPYSPFNGGKIYWFNGTIATVLGFSFFQNDFLFQQESTSRLHFMT